MPVKSEKQRRAMQAAAKGKGNIGIPKSVGQEFVGKPRTSAGGMASSNKTQQPQQSPQLQQAMMDAMIRGQR
jgi:hypothetical protein